MIKHNQDGASGLLVPFILTVLLLLGAIGFGGWAFTSRNDFKNNVDEKIQSAEEATTQKESAIKDKQFAEESKNPLKTYSGPAAYGSLVINYPKTWSGYVDESGTGSNPVDAYFNPGVVPVVGNQKSVFALHVRVLSQSYAQTIKSFASQQQAGKLTVSAYALPKLPKVVGIQASGQISEGKVVTLIVLPLRSQTIEISTDGTQYVGDFNQYILPNFSFSP